ncbi:MAG: 6-pyruvoyl-tetrahydropterin synthase-related protein, partial [Bacillota bacterium]
SYPSFGISAEEEQTPYTFGWAWQGASTSHNIVMVNTALEKGYYYYMFDRSLELGDDTVLVRKELVTQARKDLRDLEDAAWASGYRLYSETNYTYIFHRDTPKTYGVTTKYLGLAIGKSANTVTLEYPSIEEGFSENLSDYALKDISKYQLIYLSGFTYDNKADVQELLLQAANAGVKIIIDMNRIPVDPLTSRMTFFGVTAQSITFNKQYPELMYRNKIYESLPFKEEYSTWNTVYLENVNKILGYSWFKNKKLPFLATAGNSNIIFMGYNFLYHAMETNDSSIMGLMSDLLEIESNKLPERTVKPYTVTFEEDKIIIDSPEGKLNTTLAYHDNFRSDQKIINQNNLLTVVESRTEIKTVYPYLLEGFTLSTFGLFGFLLLIRIIYRKRGAHYEEK